MGVAPALQDRASHLKKCGLRIKQAVWQLALEPHPAQLQHLHGSLDQVAHILPQLPAQLL